MLTFVLLIFINYLQAEANRYPYSVSMQDGGGHFCGGSMIAKVSMRYMCSVLEYCKILFASHCIGSIYN